MLLAVICLLFVLHAALYWSWVEDDTFITLRYAENLTAGYGLVFNPGQRVEGYSNLAWVLLAAGSMSVGIDPLLTVRLTGIACGVVCLLLVWLLARRLWPAGGMELLLAPLYLAVSPILPRHAVSGLETNAYTMCFTMSLLLLVVDGKSTNRGFLAAVFLTMLFLLRPEGAAFGLLFLVLARSRGVNWGLTWILFLLALAIFLSWRWWYFGSLLPNTFYFKMTGGLEALRPGSYYVRGFLKHGGGVVLIGFGLVLLLKDETANLMRRFSAVASMQVAVILAVGIDWMHHYRFFAPLMPMLAAAMAAGIGQVLTFARQLHGRSRLPALILAAVLSMTFSNIYFDERQVWHVVMPSVHAGQYLSQSYARVGTWLHDHTPPGSVVAVSDVGAVGYYSKRTIIDMFGLVDPHIARMPGGLHSKHDSGYVLAQQPDYVVLVERLDPECQLWYWRVADSAIAASPEFVANYHPVHSIAMGFEDETARIYRRISER